MKDALLDFLGPTLIPILRSDITTGTAGNVHFRLVAVVAGGTFPDELAVGIFSYFYFTVVAAYLTEVALGVQLCVHYVVVDELEHAENCLEIVLHIGHFYVGDSTAGRELLELRLKLQLRERVNGLGNVYVVRIRNIISVGNTLYDTEAVLKALSKLIGRALKGRAIKRIVYILSCLPLRGVLVKLLHNGKSKLLALGLGKLLAVQRIYALPKSCITE